MSKNTVDEVIQKLQTKKQSKEDELFGLSSGKPNSGQLRLLLNHILSSSDEQQQQDSRDDFFLEDDLMKNTHLETCRNPSCVCKHTEPPLFPWADWDVTKIEPCDNSGCENKVCIDLQEHIKFIESKKKVLAANQQLLQNPADLRAFAKELTGVDVNSQESLQFATNIIELQTRQAQEDLERKNLKRGE